MKKLKIELVLINKIYFESRNLLKSNSYSTLHELEYHWVVNEGQILQLTMGQLGNISLNQGSKIDT